MAEVTNVRANGATIAFTRRGDGPPLVLMHGAEADHSMFDAVGKALSSRFTVIAYDQRDCGQTESPTAAYGLADLADDAAALVTALGFPRAHVYGTSFGGIVAQLLAARHPERVDRLVLASTWHARRSPLDVNPEVVRRLIALRSDPAANAPKIAEYFFPADYLEANPEAVELFRRSLPDDPRRGRRHTVTLKMENADLSRFQGPVLLLAGAEDRLIPMAATFALRDSLVHAETMALPGVAHAGAVHAPGRIAEAVMTFLS
jgi:pimeloyl-ACP methyl ester carboxylesterase